MVCLEVWFEARFIVLRLADLAGTVTVVYGLFAGVVVAGVSIAYHAAPSAIHRVKRLAPDAGNILRQGLDVVSEGGEGAKERDGKDNESAAKISHCQHLLLEYRQVSQYLQRLNIRIMWQRKYDDSPSFGLSLIRYDEGRLK